MRITFIAALLSSVILAISGCPQKEQQSPAGGGKPENGLITLKDGMMVCPDGSEVRLYGVNFQTPLSWEFNRLNRVGVEKTAEALHQVADNNLNDLQLLGVNHIRCHLTPCDLTDEQGNLIESSVFLDALDYLISEAGKRNMYVSFAFLNHMGGGGAGAAWMGKPRETWVQDESVVKCARTYIKALVNHVNKYTGKALKYTENIAFWELINEPDMVPYSRIGSYDCAGSYQAWLAENGKPDEKSSYEEYRTNTVRDYINGMKQLLREEGDNHLICWGLNWHRYRNGHEDVFKGVSESDADIVAFCNYPGQDLAGERYWSRSRNYTDVDFTSWFKEQRASENGYGWVLTPAFESKAIINYEFETFFNQSSYLYPVQATFFRSLRVQSASMWTYTFSEIAPYMGGSHFLNLRCTPGKVASFLVAQEIYRNLPYQTIFSDTPNEQKGEHFAISKSHGGAVWSDSEKYINSCPVDDAWNPVEASPEVKFVAGCGSSPLVSYTGSGLYIIKENDGELHINIMPDVEVVGDIFGGGSFNAEKTKLHSSTSNKMGIGLSAWAETPSTLYKVEGGERKSCGHIAGTASMELCPGEYVVVPE